MAESQPFKNYYGPARKLYPGRHAVDVQVNGQVLAEAEFEMSK